MKSKKLLLILAALMGVAFTTTLRAQTSAFTYQGRLFDGGAPASGTYDLMFTLYDSSNGVTAVAGPITNSAVAVTNGLFTVTSDFGAGVFDGSDRWLEIGVATNGSGVFTNLVPRQPITSTPYAIQAANAAVAASANSVSAADITGTVGLAQLPTTVLVTNGASGVNISGTFTGDAAGLTNLDSSQLTGPLSFQQSGQLVNVGHIDNGGSADGVSVSGNYAYLANSGDGLRVYDISNPANPINVGHASSFSGTTFGVAVSGNYAYLANGEVGLGVYDISDPANPFIAQHATNAPGATAYDVAVAGNYAYLANGTDGLRVYYNNNTTLLINVGHTNDGGTARGIAVSGNYAYLANDTDGLRVYDISNPANPVNVGHGTNYPGGYAYGVAVSGNYAYLANATDGLRVYDISNPANPVNVGHIDNGGDAAGVAVSGNYAYLANQGDGLRVYDISNPANPINVDHIDNGGGAAGVAVSGNYAYLANQDDGLRVYKILPEAILAGDLIVSNTVSAASFVGDGSGLLNLNAGNITTGTFTGDAAGLSNLDSAQLTGPLSFQPATPVNVGHANNGGTAYGVAVSGNYAYLANYTDGLRVYNISNPANVINVGHTNNGGTAFSVAVSGNYAYLANEADGLRVYNIGNPANPINVGHIDDGGSALGVAVSGNYAYLANFSDGLRVYDVSNPANPINVGHGTNYPGGYARSIAVAGNYAYLANDADGLRVFDISDPTNPVNVGHIDNGGVAYGVAVSGNHVYLANLADGLRVYDVSNPAHPVNVGHIDSGGTARGITVLGHYAYLANDTDGLRVYDISNPANPVNVGHIANGGAAYDVAVSGNYAYLANETDGLRVYDIGIKDAVLTGGLTVSNTVTAAAFAGDGSGLTNLNASNMSTGTLADTRLSSNVALLNRNSQHFTGTNTFAGRVGIGTPTPTSRLDVAGTITCTVLNQTSDRNAKRDFTAINPARVLQKVASLPITEWQYKAGPQGVEHVGPMAQEFHAAFGLNGSDDKHITTVDEGGVALAAIQGLNDKVEVRGQRSEVRIQKLEAENAELKARLDKIERLLNHRLNGGAR